MPKKSAKTSDEWYRGQIRELTKENRALKKENQQLKRARHMYEDLKILTEIEEEREQEIKQDCCPVCLSGTISLVIDLEDRSIFACDYCHFRKVLKK
jgi:hypothetical protein